MPTKFATVIGGLALLLGAGGSIANEEGHAGWQRAADNEIANLPSLQRGARNFMSYCSGCHSLKFARYSRIAEDLKISDALRDKYLVRPGDKFSDYIKAPMPRPMPRNGSARRRRICLWWRARAVRIGSSIFSPRSTPIRPAVRPA
jgi:hypothetical protein